MALDSEGGAIRSHIKSKTFPERVTDVARLFRRGKGYANITEQFS